MYGSYLEIKGKRRTGKTFTALLNILGRAKAGMVGKVLMIGTSQYTIKRDYREMIDICKLFDISYKANDSLLNIKIGDISLQFDTQIRLPEKKYTTIVSDISKDTVLIEDI